MELVLKVIKSVLGINDDNIGNNLTATFTLMLFVLSLYAMCSDLFKDLLNYQFYSIYKITLDNLMGDSELSSFYTVILISLLFKTSIMFLMIVFILNWLITIQNHNVIQDLYCRCLDVDISVSKLSKEAYYAKLKNIISFSNEEFNDKDIIAIAEGSTALDDNLKSKLMLILTKVINDELLLSIWRFNQNRRVRAISRVLLIYVCFILFFASLVSPACLLFLIVLLYLSLHYLMQKCGKRFCGVRIIILSVFCIFISLFLLIMAYKHSFNNIEYVAFIVLLVSFRELLFKEEDLQFNRGLYLIMLLSMTCVFYMLGIHNKYSLMVILIANAIFLFMPAKHRYYITPMPFVGVMSLLWWLVANWSMTNLNLVTWFTNSVLYDNNYILPMVYMIFIAVMMYFFIANYITKINQMSVSLFIVQSVVLFVAIFYFATLVEGWHLIGDVLRSQSIMVDNKSNVMLLDKVERPIDNEAERLKFLYGCTDLSQNKICSLFNMKNENRINFTVDELGDYVVFHTHKKDELLSSDYGDYLLLSLNNGIILDLNEYWNVTTK